MSAGLAATTRFREALPRAGIAPYRLDVGRYLRMIESEILPSEARVELLDGVIAHMAKKLPPHCYATDVLAHRLRPVAEDRWIVREHKSFVLPPRSRPEPDVALVRGPRTLYRTVAPTAADVAFVAEVADSSYAKDRGIKFRLYAAAGIPVYWIVNLAEARVEVFTDPEGSGRSAVYRTERRFGADADVPVEIEGVEVGRIPARELLA